MIGKHNILSKKISLRDKKNFNTISKIYHKELDKNYKFSKLWNKNNLRSKLQNKNLILEWILINKDIVGFIMFEKFNKKHNINKKIFIRDFFILKKYRRKRIAFIALNKILRKFKKMGYKNVEIEVLKSNLKVYKFWKKFNFKPKSLIYIKNI